MIDSPGIDLVVEPAPSWIVEGPHAPRVEQLVEHLRGKIAAKPARRCRPPIFASQSVPPEHVGLGVGTQLCLAVARAVFWSSPAMRTYRSKSSRDGPGAAAARESACTASSTAV